jgi:hypothetical protein
MRKKISGRMPSKRSFARGERFMGEFRITAIYTTKEVLLSKKHRDYYRVVVALW